MKPSRAISSTIRGGDTALAALEEWSGARRTDRNRLLWAMIPAVLLHAVLLAIRLPVSQAVAAVPETRQPLMVIQQYRVKPPEPPPPDDPAPPPTSQAPIPVPEVDPIVLDRPLEPLPAPPVEIPAGAVVVQIPVPPAPPAPAMAPPVSNEPILISGAVVAPVKLFGPEPVYPRPARLAKVGGRVIVQATINRQGEVVDLKVLVPKPMGLTEATLDAIRQWRYEPATLHGEPVAVFMALTVNYDLR